MEAAVGLGAPPPAAPRRPSVDAPRGAETPEVFFAAFMDTIRRATGVDRFYVTLYSQHPPFASARDFAAFAARGAARWLAVACGPDPVSKTKYS